MRRPLRPLLVVAAGGMVGSLVRWGLIELASPGHAETTTFAINAAGSLVLGVLIGRQERMADDHRLALGTGFCGGLTTFSAYAVTVADHLDGGELGPALVNGLGTPMVTLVAAGVGFRVARLLAVANRGRR